MSSLPQPAANPGGRQRHSGAWLAILLSLAAVLGILFVRSFQPDQVHFSNDGPLGANQAASSALPAGFTGVWGDLNWVGNWNGSALPTFTYSFLWLLGPVGFAKFYAPLCMLILGLSAFLFARQLGFGSAVCVLVGLAAALNSDFFSYACWGLGTLPLCVASVFLALAAAVMNRSAWLRFPLAGLAVGLSVMEGFDNGAIFSLYVSGFIVFQSLLAPGAAARRAAIGVGRVAIVALFAAFISAHALAILTGTQIKGIVGVGQSRESKEANWAFATQWSLPKIETLGILVPGLFGYRMDSPEGANYWGALGRDPAWDQYFEQVKAGKPPAAAPGGYLRYSGAGFYAGITLWVIAAWAMAQSFRRKDNPYTPSERKWIWFWMGMTFVSLLFAFGRHAPFYHLVYALPYFSTIRNPIKFLHPFSLALIVLFGYGLQGLYRRYVLVPAPRGGTLQERLKAWWNTAPAFDRRWILGAIFFIALSLFGWLMFASSRRGFESYLARVGFDSSQAPAIAGFSLGTVAWYVLFLALAVGAVVLIKAGFFRGASARWAAWCLGLLLVADLARANLPWIVHYNYRERYAPNPILDILRRNPHEDRVTAPLFMTAKDLPDLAGFYNVEWLQHQFQYYNIQSIDIIQMPRAPVDYAAFRGGKFSIANTRLQPRLWELTSTRYLLGLGGFLDALNQQLDPVKQRFRIHTGFEFYRDRAGGPMLVRTNLTGPFALYEYTGARPRAAVYSRWQVGTDDRQTIDQLADPAFDPAQTVIVAPPAPAPPAGAPTNSAAAGSVTYQSYAPKRVVLEAATDHPAILLLNDKFDPHWKVWIDGRPGTVLRCNFLMRGVELPPGTHRVEFRFEPPVLSLFVSLAALVLGLALCGYAAATSRPGASEVPEPKAETGPKPATAARETSKDRSR